MQCLYCNKRLGIFASKKRPFCSEVHEVAYQEEQSGLAMRRVMDPLFSEPVKPSAIRETANELVLPIVRESRFPLELSPEATLGPPLITPPESSPVSAPASSLVRPARAPAKQAGYLKQLPPKPIPLGLAGTEIPLEFELWAGGVQLPPSCGEPLAFDPDYEAPQVDAAPESPTKHVEEIAVAGNGTLDSSLLHPLLDQCQATVIAEEAAARPNAEPSPLVFSPSVALVELRRSVGLVSDPGIKEGLAEPVNLAGPAWTHGRIPLGLGDLEANLDSQRLPLRYPHPNLAIASEPFETPALPEAPAPFEVPARAEIAASHWLATRPEVLGHPEVVEAKSQVGISTPAAPGTLLRFDLPSAAARALCISPVRPEPASEVAEILWPRTQFVLPSISTANSYQPPLAESVKAAARPPAPVSRTAGGSFPAIPWQEPVPSVLAYALFQRPMLDPPAQSYPPPVAAKPLRISPTRLAEPARTEPFRWPQASLAIPPVFTAKSFRIPFAGTNSAAAVTSPAATPRKASTPDPLPPALMLHAPVPGGAPLAPALVQVRAFLAPRGLRLAGRAVLPEPREISAQLCCPDEALDRSLRLPVSVDRTVVWTASSCALNRSLLPSSTSEEIRQTERRMQIPQAPARAERFAPKGVPASLAAAAPNHPRERFRAAPENNVQRFRPAAHIRLREPEMQISIPEDLPVQSTSFLWRGIGMVSKFGEGAAPVWLRPSLQTPGVPVP